MLKIHIMHKHTISALANIKWYFYSLSISNSHWVFHDLFKKYYS